MISSVQTLSHTCCETLPAEDARWVAAARSGDADATLRLLARYRPFLVRLLAGIVGDWAAAEDLAQETFLKAFRSLGQLRDPARFYPWVRRLAVRLALREVRGRREVPLEDAFIPACPATGEGYAMSGIDTRLAVHEVLARVPPDLRITLVLRELEGLDYAEIAETLEIPVGTVRSRLFAARERFRVLWREGE
jgi:RNA polymerase sigma-70 factor, ECF subfamily